MVQTTKGAHTMGEVHEMDHPLIAAKLTCMQNEGTPTGESRTLLHQIATLMAFEATRDLPTKQETRKTPVTTASFSTLACSR